MDGLTPVVAAQEAGTAGKATGGLAGEGRGSPSLRVVAAAGATTPTVDQLGPEILAGFRVKAFALIVIQSLSMLALALAVDLAAAAMGGSCLSNMGFGALCVVAVAVLVAVAMVRRRYPWNYLGEIVFTLLAGAVVGLMAKPLHDAQEVHFPEAERAIRPHIYGLVFYTLGLVLLSLLSVLKFGAGERMLSCFFCSVVSTLAVDALFVAVWASTKFCPCSWLMTMMALASVSLLWMGLQSDRLAAQLNPDEYLLPVILVWAELIALVLVLLACCSAIALGADPGCPILFNCGGALPGEWCLYGGKNRSQVVPVETRGEQAAEQGQMAAADTEVLELQ